MQQATACRVPLSSAAGSEVGGVIGGTPGVGQQQRWLGLVGPSMGSVGSSMGFFIFLFF